MRVAGLLNTIDRYGITKRTVQENLECAGVDVELFISDNGSHDPRVIEWGVEVAEKHWANGKNIGNAQAKNIMLKHVMEQGYDYVVILDNDIRLPRDWFLKGQRAMDIIRKKGGKPGMIGWSWRGLQGSDMNKTYNLYTPKRVFGSWMAERAVFDQVGYFIEWSKYGMWDSEFNERTTRAGFVNAYPFETSTHVGYDDYDSPEYREFKDAELRKANGFWTMHNEKELTHVSWENRSYEKTQDLG